MRIVSLAVDLPRDEADGAVGRQDEEEDADEDEGEVGLQANTRAETLEDDPPAHVMMGKSISGGVVCLFVVLACSMLLLSDMVRFFFNV